MHSQVHRGTEPRGGADTVTCAGDDAKRSDEEERRQRPAPATMQRSDEEERRA
ncbi:hypothetical protein ABLN97_05360 [Mycobacterium tuberculosis]